MSGNSKEHPEVDLKELDAPSLPTMAEVQELYEYTVRALHSLRQQQTEINTQVERQVGLVSGLEILIQGKTAETLTQIREAMQKDQMKAQMGGW